MGKRTKEREEIAEQAVTDEPTEVATSSPEQQPTKRVLTRRPMPFFFRILFAVLLLAGLSIVYTWYIFWRQKSGDYDATLNMINGNLAVFGYSCLLIFLLMLVIAAVTWRVFFTAGLSFAAISIIMYANEEKMAARAAPLLPEDFLMADQVGAMTQFVDMSDIYRLAGGVVLLLIGAGLLEHFLRRWIGKDREKALWWEKFAIVPRVTLTLMASAALVLAARPIMQHSGANFYTIDWLDAEMEAWNQTSNYARNGFVLGFVYNLGTTEATRPDDYSEQRVREILAKYQQIQDVENAKREKLSDTVDNIILVMDESFYDPALLTEEYYHNAEDLVPTLHKLMAKYPSGYMYSPEYGGGTANIEFEAYTGLSNYWAKAMPYVDFLSRSSNIPGLVKMADQDGYSTTAIHAYYGSMYKRNLVYPNMGFDTFIDIDDFTYTERESPTTYLNDWSIYQEALDILHDHDGPQMLGLITMQNHTGFDCGVLDDDEVSLMDGIEWPRVSSYVCLRKTDNYLADFIDELEKLDERTVMIWFGDHAAGVLDKYIYSEDKAKQNLAHLTPYFIYANFELTKPYTAKEVAAINRASGFDYAAILSVAARTPAAKAAATKLANSIDLPTTTPNCLSNTLLDILGVKKSTLYYLVDEVCSTTPILAPSFYAGEEPEDSEVLREYELVNYDILNGEQYWFKQ